MIAGLQDPPGVEVSHANLAYWSAHVQLEEWRLEGSLRDRLALEDDVEQGDKVHQREHSYTSVKAVHEVLHRTRHTDQHARDTRFDEDDRDAKEDLEEEEPLGHISNVLDTSWQSGETHLESSRCLFTAQSALVCANAIEGATETCYGESEIGYLPLMSAKSLNSLAAMDHLESPYRRNGHQSVVGPPCVVRQARVDAQRKDNGSNYEQDQDRGGHIW